MTPRALRPYVWMLAGSLAFSVMGTLAHTLADSCSWPVIALARSIVPLVVAAGLALASGARLVFWRPGILWLRSIAGSVSLVGTFFALTRLPVADVFTLTNTFPIWLALLSWPLLQEPPTGSVWLSVASGVAGVALMQQPHFAEGNYVVLVALASSVSTAFAMLGLNRLRGIDPRAIVVHFSAVALLFSLGAVLFAVPGGSLHVALDGRSWFLLGGLGLSATLGQLCLTKAFTAGPATKVSVVGLSQVVFALGLEAAAGTRRCDFVTLVGMTLVLAPTAWLLARGAGRPDPTAELPGEIPEPGA